MSAQTDSLEYAVRETTTPINIVAFAEANVRDFRAQSYHPCQYVQPLRLDARLVGADYYLFGQLLNRDYGFRSGDQYIAAGDFPDWTVIIREDDRGTLSVSGQHAGRYA